MSVEVTYVCAQTGKSVVSSDGLPEGWVVPKMDLSSASADVEEKKVKPLPRYTVVAFSSEDALRKCRDERLNRFNRS